MGLVQSAPYFILRIALAAAAGLVFHFRRGGHLLMLNGRDVAIDGKMVTTGFMSEKSRLGHTTFMMATSVRSDVEFDRESWADTQAKNLGISSEIQTADAAFDPSVYVGSDSPSFAAQLRSHAKLRSAVKDFLFVDGTTLKIAGGYFRARMLGDCRDDQARLKGFVEVFRELESVGGGVRAGDDHFAGKMKFVVSLLAALAVYDIGSYFEFTMTRGRIFVDENSFYGAALLATVIGPCVIVGLVVWTLRGSSRAHFIFTRYFLLLVLAVGPACAFLMADIDRYFDFRAPIIVDRLVTDTKEVVTRTSKGGTRYTYTGCFEPAALAGRAGEGAALNLSPCLNISRTDFYALKNGQGVRFQIGRGAIGYQWIKRIQPLEM